MPSRGDRDDLVIVSNRGPLVLQDTPEGVTSARAVSGLVSAVEPVIESVGGVWVAWSGRTSDRPEGGLTIPVPANSPRYKVQEVLLSEKEIGSYYQGFANGCLWPLSHCFIEKCIFDVGHWESYITVNRRFATSAALAARDKHLVWVHDFHLALVPEILRRLLPHVRVAFFWHIPFPPYDVYRTLPWAKEVLKGLLGCDTLAFHLPGYVENFLLCVERLLHIPVNWGQGSFYWKGRQITVQSLPIGVDAESFRILAEQPRMQEQAAAIRRAIGTPHLVLGVDRLDYTKGILERLKAIEKFLEKYPEYHGKVTFLQIAVPTRGEVAAYQQLRRLVEEAVGHINGKFGDHLYTPVRYLFRSFSREGLVAHYLAADVALITPLRDGLNLVAKEYVASRLDDVSMLVLSPFAGAAEQLSEALFANPYNPEDVAIKLKTALEMSPEEKARRMRALRQEVYQHDLQWWWRGVKQSVTVTGAHKFEVSVRSGCHGMPVVEPTISVRYPGR